MTATSHDRRGSLDSTPGVPGAEERRLTELARYVSAAEQSDPGLADVVALAAQLTGATAAAISLVDAVYVRVVAETGLEITALPRDGSFCTCAIEANSSWFEVADAVLDPRFHDHPLVTKNGGRHYAAATLVGPRGYAVGTLWVLATEPGTFDAEQRLLLEALAKQVVDVLELHATSRLTGLPDRSSFVRRLQQRLRSAGAVDIVVGYVDLNGFHLFNDVYGRRAGDRLLEQAARRLVGWAGEGQLVAHLRADEFAFAIGSASSQRDRSFDTLSAALDAPYDLGDLGVHRLTARVGVLRTIAGASMSAAATLDAVEAAARQVDLRTETMIHDMTSERRAETALLGELRAAIAGYPDAGRIAAYYQPQVDVEAGRLIGFDALVRWNHPTRGMLRADEFVPLAEANGLISRLDLLVVDRVCADLRAWLDQRLPVVITSLNLSHASLLDPASIGVIDAVLAAHGVPAGLLEVEISEQHLLQYLPVLRSRIHELHRCGVRVAIGDFGTGYSSLEALTTFSFERLKVDRRFVHGISREHQIASRFLLIQGFAELFDVELLCEGLEEEADLAHLTHTGATKVQGFYFSPARPPASAGQLLAALDALCAGDRALSPEGLRDVLAGVPLTAR